MLPAFVAMRLVTGCAERLGEFEDRAEIRIEQYANERAALNDLRLDRARRLDRAANAYWRNVPLGAVQRHRDDLTQEEKERINALACVQ